MDIGPPELLIILAVVLVLFGGKKLPELARSLGKAKQEFQDGLDDKGEQHHARAITDSTTPTSRRRRLRRRSRQRRRRRSPRRRTPSTTPARSPRRRTRPSPARIAGHAGSARRARISAMRLGIAHHLGWAVVVTASDDHEVVDRRRIELIEPGLPGAPIHHEGGPHVMHRRSEPLDDDALAALVADVRGVGRADRVGGAGRARGGLPGPIDSMAVRAWPADFPGDIAVQRRVPYESRADSVMYCVVLAELARDRGWSVVAYDAKSVESEATRLLGERAHEVLHGPRARLGPPWTKDHRMALAATIVGSLIEVRSRTGSASTPIPSPRRGRRLGRSGLVVVEQAGGRVDDDALGEVALVDDEHDGHEVPVVQLEQRAGGVVEDRCGPDPTAGRRACTPRRRRDRGPRGRRDRRSARPAGSCPAAHRRPRATSTPSNATSQRCWYGCDGADPQGAGIGDEHGAGGEALGVVGREGDDDLATEPVAPVDVPDLEQVDHQRTDVGRRSAISRRTRCRPARRP